MFSLEEARRLVGSGSSHIRIGHEGHTAPFAEEGRSTAVAIVRTMSDAVKHVSDNSLIEGSVDRDQVWVATEFVVSAEVIESLDQDIPTVEAFYKAVEARGYEWEISVSSSDP